MRREVAAARLDNLHIGQMICLAIFLLYFDVIENGALVENELADRVRECSAFADAEEPLDDRRVSMFAEDDKRTRLGRFRLGAGVRQIKDFDGPIENSVRRQDEKGAVLQ